MVKENALLPLLVPNDDDTPKAAKSLTISKKRRDSVAIQGLPVLHRHWTCTKCGMQVGNFYPRDDNLKQVFDSMILNFICSNCRPMSDNQISCSKCNYRYGSGTWSSEMQIFFICYSCINESLLIPESKFQRKDLSIVKKVMHTKKTKRSRHYLQKTFPCSTCTDRIIVLNFYSGNDEVLDTAQIVCDWTCAECFQNSDSTHGLLFCGICKRRQGSGSIRYKDHLDIVDLLSKKKKDHDLDIMTQITCNDCVMKWQICSECGGGGRMRTGKYRPVELFLQGRRTCRLSHIRLGTNITDFDCWSSKEPQKFMDLKYELASVHEDSYLSINALPELMENPEWPFKTFISLKEYINSTFNNLMTQMITYVPCKRRYIAVAFGVNYDKKVFRASNNSSLILFNHDNFNIGNSRKIIVGYACLEWEVGSPVFYLTHIVLRAINSNSTIFQDLITILVKEALKDHSTEKQSVPVTFLVTRIRQEYSRILLLAEKLGFTQDYKLNDQVDGFHSLTVSLIDLLNLNEKLQMELKLLTLFSLSILYYKISQSPNKTTSNDAVVESVPKIGYLLGPIWLLLICLVYTMIFMKSMEELRIWGIYEIFGTLLCISSTILRLWCYRTLGRLFTFDLAIRSRHKLVTTGPYKYIRHPSYTGLILATLGYSMFIYDPKMVIQYCSLLNLDPQNLGTRVFFNLMMLSSPLFISILIVKRIPKEEAMLSKEFKEKWVKYTKITWKLLPYIW